MALNRKRKTIDPCEICRLHRSRCVCAWIPKLDLKTKVSLIVHAKELKRTTNTGRLALHALVNSEMFVRGLGTSRLDLSPLFSDQYDSYVLYPSDDAMAIEDLKVTKPIQLIVADGNWRQASKVLLRHLELAHLPRVKIRPQLTNKFHLRKEHFSDGLSTIEAIAWALRVIEGEDTGNQMLALYQAKLNATVQGRGVKDVEANGELHTLHHAR